MTTGAESRFPVGRLRSIQILRGLAASMVVLCHCTQLMVGQVGVDVFFVISGFIIYRVSQGRSAAGFLADRAIRIFPLWWIMAVPWIGIAAKIHILTPQMLAATVSLWPVYDVVAGPAHEPGWSLQFEELFYLATALGLAIPRARALLPLLWGACLVGALISGNVLLRFLGNPLILEFFAGILIAKIAFNSRALGAAAIIFALAAYGWIALRGPGELGDQIAAMNADHPWHWLPGGAAGPAWRFLLWGTPSAALVWGALQFEEAFSAAWWRALVYLGNASYSIYLSNFLARLFLHYVLPGWAQIIPCIVVGVVVYRFIEQPIHTYLRRATPPRAVAQPA